MAGLNDIESIIKKKLERAVSKLPTILGNEAVNWSKTNFTRQGFPAGSFQRWPPRKAGAKRNTGRALLVSSGRLKRSIRLISTAPLRATFGTDVPYAAAHNNGFRGTVNVSAHKRAKIGTVKVSTGKTGQKFSTKKTITGVGQVRAHQREMNLPRRRFIGYSPVLQSILRRKATVVIGRELKS